MIVQFIPTDAILDKLHDMYMENLPHPQDVEKALEHIQSQVDHKTYLEIEDDLSKIMDCFEVRGFHLGFRVGFKTVLSFSLEEMRE